MKQCLIFFFLFHHVVYADRIRNNDNKRINKILIFARDPRSVKIEIYASAKKKSIGKDQAMHFTQSDISRKFLLLVHCLSVQRPAYIMVQLVVKQNSFLLWMGPNFLIFEYSKNGQTFA